MTRSRVAWGIAGLDVVAMLVISSAAPSFDIIATVLYVAGIASFAAVGALLCTRVPANPIGALLLAAGTVLVAAIVVGTYADLGAAQTPPWPGSGLARLAGNTMFVYPFAIALVGIPLVFPDGRLPSARYRWIARLAVADMVVWTIGGFIGASPDGVSAAVSPGIDALVPLFGALQAFVLVATLTSFGAAIVAIATRFRRGDPVQRQQVKWLAAVVAVGATVLPVSLVFNDVSPELANALSSFAVLTMFALPVAIGVAILRYRLFEIDRIISRTLSWAFVTGILVAAFAVVVVAMQAVLAGFTQGETLAVAASTLVAFALFQPVRRRVQSVIDRRFNRSRYDAERTAAAFAERLRGQVDLAGVEADLARTVDASLRPRSTGIWLRAEPKAGR